MPRTICFVTTNEGKFNEVQAVLEPIGFTVVQKIEEYPEVQVDTLEEVTMFGLEHLKEVIHEEFIIEDSGLFIESLKGFPGVYSAYAQLTIGNQGILRLMGDKKERAAVFKSCFGHFSFSKGPLVVTGACKGQISLEERGTNGFGYDPIFIPKGKDKTFGEMAINEKNLQSHRRTALDDLVKTLRTRGPFP